MWVQSIRLASETKQPIRTCGWDFHKRSRTLRHLEHFVISLRVELAVSRISIPNFRSIQSFNEFGSPNRTLCSPSETHPRGKRTDTLHQFFMASSKIVHLDPQLPGTLTDSNFTSVSCGNLLSGHTAFTYRNPQLKQPIVTMLMIWPLDAIHHSRARLISQQDMNFYFL